HRRASVHRGSLRSQRRSPATPTWTGATRSGTLHAGARARTGCRSPPLQRQVGKFGADFAERKRRIEAEFGLGMDGAAQANDARGDLLRPIEELLGRHDAMVARGSAPFQRRAPRRPCHARYGSPSNTYGEHPRDAAGPIIPSVTVAQWRHRLDFREKP